MANLRLVFERRGALTILAHAYAEPPFVIRRTFALGDAAYVILVCAGPGVFGGDTLTQHVHVGAGARVVLTSQASLQAHPSGDRPARIDHTCIVEEGGELHVDWDPLIPFARACVEQRYRVQLAASAALWWSDAILSGRAARGERWQFHALSHELRLEVAGALRYLERYRLEPAAHDARRRWIAGDADYIGTALAHHPAANASAADALHQELAAVAGVHAAVDAVEDGLIAARIASADGVAFAAARAALRRGALSRVFQSPHLMGRKSV